MVENYQEMLSSEHSGFIRHNGIRVVSVDEEKSVLTADVTPENSNIWGGVHGGFLYAMADTAAGAFARINYGQHNVTLNGSTICARRCSPKRSPPSADRSGSAVTSAFSRSISPTTPAR